MGRACASCVRRGNLLASIGARLEIRSRLRGRLLELLALSDDELLAEVGCGPIDPAATQDGAQVSPQAPGHPEAICRHDPSYPASLRDDGGPRVLYVRGGLTRLHAITLRPAVAICGSARSTDYGIEMARAIATELAAHGVTLVSGLADVVAATAQHQACAAAGSAVAVMAGGHRAGCPASRRALAGRISALGCVLAEVPEDCDGRVWGRIAAARVLARLATVTLVIEADDTPVDLAPAEVARELGRTVAVMPGRVTSPASRGAHRLIIEGARLVRGAADVLELARAGETTGPETQAPIRVDRQLKTTLELVGAGSDTPQKLERCGVRPGDALLALSRLEVLGLLARGDGGRYVVCRGLEVARAARHESARDDRPPDLGFPR